MVNFVDIRYVRLGTRDLVGADRFAREIVGLEFCREENGARYYRSDERDHTLVYFDGDPSDHTVAFEVATRDALDEAAAELESLGVRVHVGQPGECEQRRVAAFIRFSDPTGNVVEAVHRPHHSGRRFFPSRDAGLTGFSHVGLCTTSAARDERFWTDVLGARVSDRIGEAALLRIDPVHHRVALFPTHRKGIQHVNHQVASIDDVMRAWYQLRSRNIKIVFGPGRHPTSGAVFLYFEGPDGMIYEYSTGVRLIAPDEEATHRARQFPAVESSFCMWGSSPDIAEFRRP